MLTIHHLNNSRSQRILWFLEELKAESSDSKPFDYQIKYYQRDSKTMLAPDELKQIHPLGKSPVITDGDLTIAETGAIIEYLVDTYADHHWRPQRGTQARNDYNYWIHAAEGTYAPYLVMKLVFSKLTQPPVPFVIRPITKSINAQVNKQFIDPNIQRGLEHLENTLAGQNWLLGDALTAADIMMSFVVEGSAARIGLEKNYPNIHAYKTRFQSRAAYKLGLEKGGPYQLGL
jgi:glutathione S-transferase